MGMVVLNTLPVRARKTVKKEIARNKRSLIPATALLTRNSHVRCHDSPGIFGVNSIFKLLPFLKDSTCNKWHDWSLDGFFVHPGIPGNIATLGGSGQTCENDKVCADEKAEEKFEHPWKYLNTNLKNTLKVVFIPKNRFVM